jgi:protein-tyrosine phosphatase
MDDGAKDVAQAMELLGMLKKDGVDVVVATPHFYLDDDSVDDFLKARSESALRLNEAILSSKKNFPEIRLGAEVYFSPALLELEIDKLCISGTNYLLIELPYQSFSTVLLNSFHDFVRYCGHGIILAHIERYFEFNTFGSIDEILEGEVLAQFNCDSALEWRTRNRLLKLFFEGRLHIMGSDAHDPVRRPPRFGKAEKFLRRKYGNNEVNLLLKAAELAIKNAESGKIAGLRQGSFSF